MFSYSYGLDRRDFLLSISTLHLHDHHDLSILDLVHPLIFPPSTPRAPLDPLIILVFCFFSLFPTQYPLISLFFLLSTFFFFTPLRHIPGKNRRCNSPAPLALVPSVCCALPSLLSLGELLQTVLVSLWPYVNGSGY